MTAVSKVDDYVAGLPAWQAEIAEAVRALVRAEAPEATETVKWAQPVWESGGPFAYLKAFGKTVNVGFWRGAELEDPEGLLAGEGDRMRHVSLTSASLPGGLGPMLRQAVALNAASGDPTKRRR